METVSKVRRWVKADGMSIREVCRRTVLSRNTVRKYLRDENAEPQYRMTKPRSSRRLLDHEVHLRAMYEGDLAKPSRERRSMQGLFEALVCEGYTGSYDTVRRYIVRLKGSCASIGQGYIPLEFNAGDALQFDWSHEVVVLGGVEQKIRVAHFRLCHSRKPFIVAYLREAQEMVLDAFNRALAFYGGVPRRVIIDNPKTMVVFIGKGKERVFHPRFMACMSHYAIEPVACTPAAGWGASNGTPTVRETLARGQVENQVKTLRGQVFAPKLYFDTLEDLNVHLQARCEALASKPHPEAKTRSIDDVFADEREQLRPLGRAFDGYTERQARVSGYCLVRFDTNSYSVPSRYAHQRVSLRAYADRVVISDGREVIAEHARCFDKHQRRFCLWHYLPFGVALEPVAVSRLTPAEAGCITRWGALQTLGHAQTTGHDLGALPQAAWRRPRLHRTAHAVSAARAGCSRPSRRLPCNRLTGKGWPVNWPWNMEPCNSQPSSRSCTT